MSQPTRIVDCADHDSEVESGPAPLDALPCASQIIQNKIADEYEVSPSLLFGISGYHSASLETPLRSPNPTVTHQSQLILNVVIHSRQCSSAAVDGRRDEAQSIVQELIVNIEKLESENKLLADSLLK